MRNIIIYDKEIDLAVRAFNFYTKYGNPDTDEFISKLSQDKKWIWRTPSRDNIEAWKKSYKWDKRSRDMAISELETERNAIREEIATRARQRIMIGDELVATALKILSKVDLDNLSEVDLIKLIPMIPKFIKDGIDLQQPELQRIEESFSTLPKDPSQMTKEELDKWEKAMLK